MTLLTHRSPRSLSKFAAHAGFTLAEVLLASVLGALLLTALAVNTFGFTMGLDALEEKAGVKENPDPDPILRRMTKDIREAYWAEMPSSNELRLATPEGEVTRYWVTGSDLHLMRPNGDQAVILKDFSSMTMEPTFVERKREGNVVSGDGKWLDVPAPAGTPMAIEIPAGNAVALAFTTPATPAEIPGAVPIDEELLSVQTSVIDLHIAGYQGSRSKKLQVSLYESWAPGKARPYDSALAAMECSIGSLPQAVAVGGGWQVPATTTALSLSCSLEPGVGYTLVLTATGSSKLVFQAVPKFPTTGFNEVAMQVGTGPWVAQPMVVPFDIKDPWTRTSTITEEVLTRVTVSVVPQNRPLIQRSAALLSQTVSDDPWLGVVAGESAP